MSTEFASTSTPPEVSVVVPVFNEEPNIRELHRRLTETMEGLGRSFEIIVVDDGSTDGSVELLKAIREEDSRLRIVRLARNFGQSPALYAGFAHVRGEIIVMLDADLQNPPEELAKLIHKLDEGYDFVNGWRQGRNDSVARTLPSRFLNYLIKKTTNAQFNDAGCALKAFRRNVIEMLLRFTHHSRYLSVDVAWLGVSTAEVPVDHVERSAGTSKYGLRKLLRTGFDLVTSVTAAPLQILGALGWVFAGIGFFMAMRVAYVRVFQGDDRQLGTVVALFFILSGVQLIATGLMCEYISRIYIEVQNRPYYVVKEIIE
ncbi:MAG: glycosyltransferase [Candidatus Hydrogenedentes bacterium]|nr:glycosyltransferase [Candidatus Hydrogenedentota bacterium]